MDPQQPDLIIVQSVVIYKSRGLEAKDPTVAVRALEMLCMGCGYREVELATGVKFDALMGLRNQNEC